MATAKKSAAAPKADVRIFRHTRTGALRRVLGGRDLGYPYQEISAAEATALDNTPDDAQDAAGGAKGPSDA